MMRAFAIGMGLPEDSFLKAIDKPIARSSIIHYPPQPEYLGEKQIQPELLYLLEAKTKHRHDH